MPKRAAERRRRNISGDVDTVTVSGPADPPPVTMRDLETMTMTQLRTLVRDRGADLDVVMGRARKADLVAAMATGLPKFHVIAREWVQSLKASGQSVYYEPSDWSAALLVAESMTRLLNKRSYSAELFAAVWKGMTDLLTTEAARRRARIEIERIVGGPSNEPKISVIDDYRRSLEGAASADEDGDDE